MTSPRIYCVTGMHRSGTSLVSRVINLLGASLGPDEDLMPAKADNPAGFWESKTITQINDDLLARLGGSWLEPPAPEPGWEDAPHLGDLRKRALAALAAFGPVDLIAWKDPRTSLLLPFWRTVSPIAGTILTVRDPQEVAASLGARNDIDAETAARLWMQYVGAAWINDPDHLLVRYGDFFGDLEGTVAKLAKFIGAEADAERQAEIAAAFQPELRHRAERKESGGMMRLAGFVFETIDQPRVAGAVLAQLQRGWDYAGLADRHQRLADRARDLALQIKDLQRHRDELIDERDIAVRLRDELATKLSAVEGPSGRYAVLQSRVDMQNAALAKLELANEALGRELAATRLELEQAKKAMEALPRFVQRRLQNV